MIRSFMNSNVRVQTPCGRDIFCLKNVDTFTGISVPDSKFIVVVAQVQGHVKVRTDNISNINFTNKNIFKYVCWA